MHIKFQPKREEKINSSITFVRVNKNKTPAAAIFFTLFTTVTLKNIGLQPHGYTRCTILSPLVYFFLIFLLWCRWQFFK